MEEILKAESDDEEEISLPKVMEMTVILKVCTLPVISNNGRSNELLCQTKLISWSSDFPTLIIQNQNFNKKKIISDDQSQKCSCPTTCSFFFT